MVVAADAAAHMIDRLANHKPLIAQTVQQVLCIQCHGRRTILFVKKFSKKL
jgi:hypothetical protein